VCPESELQSGHSLIIKGEVSGTDRCTLMAESRAPLILPVTASLFGGDGKRRRQHQCPRSVILGKVQGNIQCTDRVDIHREGSLSGDVVTQRISVRTEPFWKAA